MSRGATRGWLAVAELLTAKEMEALELSARLSNLLYEIMGDGAGAEGDWAEMVAALHVIQRAVAAQAACRAYPEKGYRLLGTGRASRDATRGS